ncbi:hypothetical protein KIN20_015836 [Parelaphostrongylus tenuis]|uniref:Uncharacterized protein n=1 Tax=Parelaphostrongylus tenuis TaxID=148309 RepID=A0AAD5MXV3_PARTN|nr:hypothetical protein KIN20_015836 [Parelaphostrongylus tenuis]
MFTKNAMENHYPSRISLPNPLLDNKGVQLLLHESKRQALANMKKYPSGPLMISLLATMSTVSGCGVMPAGQARTISFTVTGFTLPVAMVYTEKPEAIVRVPGIATSKAGARAFVERLVMQTVSEVLESQGRSALLPDAVIASILSQLSVRVSYEPMNCNMVANLGETVEETMPLYYCIIAGDTVTGICTAKAKTQKCEAANQQVTITEVSPIHLSISGTLETTNIIMANWSKAMWQNVVNRAIRMLAWGSLGSHFLSAFATVN